MSTYKQEKGKTKLSKPTNQTLVEQASNRIRDMILNLELFPGQTILLEDLSDRLGMSRTPVRQAVERLCSGMEGLLRMVPRKGIMVAFPAAEDLREIYEIMYGLEGVAVRLALKRLDDLCLVQLDSGIDRQEEALARNDRVAWADADRHFHGLLIDAAGNSRLKDLVSLFRVQLNRARVAALDLRTVESLRESTGEHRELVQALRTRDTARALEVHDRHRQRTIDELPRIVQESVRMIVQARLEAPPA